MDGKRSVGEVTGVILAGGAARRFRGAHKATLVVAGMRIIDRQLAALGGISTAQLIVANTLSTYADLGVPVVRDLVRGAGPLGGLYTALATMPTSRAIVMAGDLPFVHEAFLRFLIDYAPEADLVVPQTREGLHPLCAVYAGRIRREVASRLASGAFALHRLAAAIATVVVPPDVVARFDEDGQLLANINTPAEYLAQAAFAGTRQAVTPRHIR